MSFKGHSINRGEEVKYEKSLGNSIQLFLEKPVTRGKVEKAVYELYALIQRSQMQMHWFIPSGKHVPNPLHAGTVERKKNETGGLSIEFREVRYRVISMVQ